MSCDLTNGRLLAECNVGRGGLKTLFVAKYNDFQALTGVVVSGGEITDMGADPITIYRFEAPDSGASYTGAVNSSPENGTVFVEQTLNLTLLNIQPADVEQINALIRGRWVVFTLDYQGKIRVFGSGRGATISGGNDQSGLAAGDKKGIDLTFVANEDGIALFLADYTDTPFDNFSNVTLNPAY